MLAIYRVARYFPKDNEELKKDLWEKVRSTVAAWEPETTLEDRAISLQECLPRRMGKDGKQPKLGDGPVSAASKLAWFFAPRHWTMYDSRASASLGANSFVHHYRILQRLGFIEWCNEARPICRRFHPDLFPKRIWDKLLYLCTDWFEPGKRACRNIDESDRRLAREICSARHSQPLEQYLLVRFPFPSRAGA